MKDDQWDLLDLLGPDASACVFNCLNDPTDVVHTAAVSKSWCNFVMSNEFGKRLCVNLCPEISNITDVEFMNFDEASSSISSDWPIVKKEHVVYTYLAHCLLNHNSDKACVLTCIGASSTDRFPEESIENTLEPSERVFLRPSYWCSGGQRDPDVQESLVYRLDSDLCIVSEIRIRPFKAFIQYGHPIYSAQRVRFRLGHSKLSLSEQYPFTKQEESLLTRDDNYVWNYISPEYPMAQDSNLQDFKLPRPILCIGGVLKIELLGGVQKQAIDGLYYVCVCHVQVIGHQVSPCLGVATSANHIVLRYCPESSRSATVKSSESISANH